MKILRHEKILIIFTAIFLALIGLIAALPSGDSGTLAILGEEKATQYFIDINTATADELDSLSGIGPALAKQIIDYRKTHGNFKTTEDLTNVPGIGDKTLDRIRDLIKT